MPQLTPDPWFNIFIMSWMTLLAIVLPLIRARTKTSDPEIQAMQSLLKKKNWNWPWN